MFCQSKRVGVSHGARREPRDKKGKDTGERIGLTLLLTVWA